MAVFPSFKLTEKGEELLNRSIGEGKTLTFTKFELGDGNTPSDFRKQTGLVNKFYEFPILNTSIQKDQVLRIRGYFDNKSFSQDKQLKEIGVFVKIEGNETQYLYSYTNAGDTGDIIPANSRGFYSRTLDVANYIGYATNITFNIEQLRDRYAFNTENEMKVASYLKAGDKVELWGNLVLGDKPTDEYIIQDSGEIELSNGLFAKKVSFKYIAKTIEEMQKLALKVGDVIEVLGYYQAGDGAGHKRVIADSDDGSGVQLNNGKWANIVHNGIIHSNWFGANKSGDITDIFKKIVAYNKPTIIDYGTYTITDYIFMEDNTILEDNGTYTDKYVIRSLPITPDLPQWDKIGTIDYTKIDVANKTGSYQAICYLDDKEEYALTFSDNTSSGLKSSLVKVDKNFNFIKSVQGDYDHSSGLTYKKDTNEILVAYDFGKGSLNQNAVAIFDADTLAFKERKDFGETVNDVTYDNELNLLATLTTGKVTLYDNNYRKIKEINIIHNNETTLMNQNMCFFKGNIVYLLNENEGYMNRYYLRFYNLKGELIAQKDYNVQNGMHPGGLDIIDNNTLITSSYKGKDIINVYYVDFKKHSHNRQDIITSSHRFSVYIDSGALYEGDGSQARPFKTIYRALEECKNYSRIYLYLKGVFDEIVDLKSYGEIFIQGDNTKTTKVKGFDVAGVGLVRVNKISVETTGNNFGIFFIGGCLSLQNVIINYDSLVDGEYNVQRGVAIYNGVGYLENVTINNSNCPVYATQGSVVQTINCKGTGNGYKFVANGGIIIDQAGNKITNNKGTFKMNNGQIFGEVTAETLNTPYHTTRMAQEDGTTLTDFYAYLDEKYVYDKQVEAEQKAKYEAYELLLQENPELTWEEFGQTYGNTSMMNLSLVERIQEPQIPESVVKFMEKYL